MGVRMRLSVMTCVALLLLGAPVGCAQKGPIQDPSALEGPRWAATGIANGTGELVSVLGGTDVYAEFGGRRVAGSSGVNNYSAAYRTTAEDGIEITAPTSTLMAGPAPLMDQERQYLAQLEAASRYRVSSTTLELLDEDGEVLVRYEAATPSALERTLWLCTGYNNGKEAVVSPIAESRITAQFREDGTVGGSSGVNTYSTSYSTSGRGAIVVDSEITTTKLAGPEELMVQEAAYLAALPRAGFYRLSGDTLELRESADGPLIATYIVGDTQ